MGRAPLIAVTGRRRSAAGVHTGPAALDALEAPDGVVEGVELPGARLLAVQWHPEQMGHPEQLDAPQPEFGWLVDAAR